VFPLAKACRAIAAHAATVGVKTSIENHGLFLAHAGRVAQLVQTVSHPNFGLTLDLGNLLWADQDVLQATAWLAPYAVTVHAKDFQVGSGDPAAWPTFPGGPAVLPVATGAGNLPLGEQIDACLSTDRPLVWVVEFEGPHGDVMAEVKRSYEWLHRQLG
jgi:sugar phosphate isomerase/epimerase